MSSEKPVHVPRDRYPEAMYPKVIASPIGDYQGGDEVHLLEYWRVIVARRWIILAVLVTVVLTTVIYTFKQTSIYRAVATIQIDKENPNILTFKDVYQMETSTDDTLRTQFEILKSRSLARRVIEDLSLETQEEFVRGSPTLIGSFGRSVRQLFIPASPKEEQEEAQDPMRPLIGQYIDRLEVTPVQRSRLVNVSFESKDPELAARVVNSHARHFIQQNLQFKVEATQEASNFLEQNLGNLRGTLEKSEDRLQQYSRENQILFTEEGKNTATEKLRQLEDEYTRVLADRIEKESYSSQVKNGNTDALPQLIQNALIADLTAKLADLQRQESELRVTFRPEYPLRQRLSGQIAQIQNSIESEKARVVKMILSQHSVSVERERLLSSELEKQRALVEKINQEIIYYNILKREVDSTRKLHDGLLTRLKEAGISAGLTASNIRVVDPAEVPRSPVRPRKALNLILSVVAGLLMGVAIAFFQEYVDNSIKAPEEVTRHLNLPTLGMIPRLESLAGKQGYGYGRYGYGHAYGQTATEETADLLIREPENVDLIVQKAPSSLMAEAYRSVRTSLLLSSSGQPPRVIVVTSASPSEGKTTTTINLAISLTQTGAKVLLIDADMRKPRVHTVFSLQPSIGLSAFLAGTTTLKEVIHPTEIPGLMLIPCGVTPPNPGELILSNGFKRMVEAVREYFDYVVLDSPPVGNVSDARILSVTADATILVVKAFATARHHAQDAAAHLTHAHAHIAGVVLNDVDVRRRSYYSGSSYYRTYYSGNSAGSNGASRKNTA